MTPKQRKGMAERLNLLHENTRHEGINEAGGNPRLPRKRPMKSAKCFQNTSKIRIPRKPSPAQIERFEALRARVMGIPGSR